MGVIAGQPLGKFPNTWNSIFLYDNIQCLGGSMITDHDLYMKFQQIMDTYTRVKINNEFYYKITNQMGVESKKEIDNWILSNFTNKIYYYQLVMWFEDKEEAILFKMLYVK